MSDYSREMFMDPTVTIKTEPILSDGTSLMITSASVPIPSRNEYRDYGIEVETSQSPVYQLALPGTYEGNMWGGSILNADEMLKSEALIMDEDDIFQVDKADLLQDPTLAELNANDENLLGDFNFDDLLLPEEGSYASLAKAGLANNNPLVGACSLPNTSLFFYREIDQASDRHTLISLDKNKTPISTLSPNSPTSSTSSLQHSGTSPSHIGGPQKHSTLHELLMKREAYGSSDSCQLGQSVPSRPMLVTSPNTKVQRGLSRLSTSAPTHLGFEQIWQRREPKIRQISTSSLVEAGSTSSLSTGGILSPDPQDLSHDEFDSDEDSEGHYEDYSTDNDSDEEREPNSQRSGSKKERFFWQYNVQAKGPKGQRLVMKSKMEDPHVLNEAQDPVFSSECSVRGIKHSGKARKGDGNDLTPNARKLYAIGRELDKLGRIINDMTPVSELPFNVRPTSRKEKNKLASRACRLKKKAQHEANKIKLSGLEVEHKRLLSGIAQVKQILMTKLNERDKLSLEQQDELTKNIEKIAKGTQKYKVAGHTTEYVNKILDKAKGGGMTVLLEDM